MKLAGGLCLPVPLRPVRAQAPHERLKVFRLGLGGREPTHLFDLYVYAKDRGLVDKIPGLSLLVEKCRQQNAASAKGADRGSHGE